MLVVLVAVLVVASVALVAVVNPGCPRNCYTSASENVAPGVFVRGRAGGVVCCRACRVVRGRAGRVVCGRACRVERGRAVLLVGELVVLIVDELVALFVLLFV